MSPALKEIFSGDLFYLSCDNSTSGSTVKWFFNGNEQAVKTKTWRVASATPDRSGSYQCEINGQRSERLSIHVHGKYITLTLAQWSLISQSVKGVHTNNSNIYLFTIQHTPPEPYSPSRLATQWWKLEVQLSWISTMTSIWGDGTAGSTGETGQGGLCWRQRLTLTVWTFNPCGWKFLRQFSGVLTLINKWEVTKSQSGPQVCLLIS